MILENGTRVVPTPLRGVKPTYSRHRRRLHSQHLAPPKALPGRRKQPSQPPPAPLLVGESNDQARPLGAASPLPGRQLREVASSNRCDGPVRSATPRTSSPRSRPEPPPVRPPWKPYASSHAPVPPPSLAPPRRSAPAPRWCPWKWLPPPQGPRESSRPPVTPFSLAVPLCQIQSLWGAPNASLHASSSSRYKREGIPLFKGTLVVHQMTWSKSPRVTGRVGSRAYGNMLTRTRIIHVIHRIVNARSQGAWDERETNV